MLVFGIIADGKLNRARTIMIGNILQNKQNSFLVLFLK